jgi:hypothetical protein
LWKGIGQQAVGNLLAAGFGQEDHPVFGDRRVERCAPGLPVGDEFIQGAGVDHCAGQDVGADFGGLFDQADGKVLPFFCVELLEPDGGREPCRPTANDQDIEFHCVTFHCFLLLNLFDLFCLGLNLRSVTLRPLQGNPELFRGSGAWKTYVCVCYIALSFW